MFVCGNSVSLIFGFSRLYALDCFSYFKKFPIMEVIKSKYAATCTLREYVELYTRDFSVSEALGTLLDSCIVACSAGTNLRLSEPFTLNKVSSIDEPLETMISEAAEKRNTKENMLSLGFRRGSDKDGQPMMGKNAMTNVVRQYHNNMTSLVQWPEFEELHGLIGTDVLFYLLKKLSIFVKKGNSTYIQVTGLPLNEMTWRSEIVTREAEDNENGWFNVICIF